MSIGLSGASRFSKGVVLVLKPEHRGRRGLPLGQAVDAVVEQQVGDVDVAPRGVGNVVAADGEAVAGAAGSRLRRPIGRRDARLNLALAGRISCLRSRPPGAGRARYWPSAEPFRSEDFAMAIRANSPHSRDIAYHLPSLHQRRGPRGAGAAYHRGRRRHLRHRRQRQALYRGAGRPVVHVARLQRAQAGRGGGQADARNPLLPQLRPQDDAAGHRARRAADRDDAGADVEGVLHQLGLGGQRHPGQDDLVLQQRAGPARKEEDHLAAPGLPRRHRRRRQPHRPALRAERVRRSHRQHHADANARIIGGSDGTQSPRRTSPPAWPTVSSNSSSTRGPRPSPPSSPSPCRAPAG